ncbi:MAG: malto-oligosyltrehalose trehalohydrolase, partial [Dietzia sp.]|nr:malto-oligosyltrehalose trehalohydrolase [Dietzia sp.]
MTFPSSDTFSVWAPTAEAVGLVLDSADADPIAMHRTADGWWASTVVREQGRDYGFVVTGDDGEV